MHDDREWHAEYTKRKAEEGEYLPEFLYPTNREVNKQVNASWKRYIKKPDLLSRISKLRVPALFVYGDRDIRPSWPAEQIANLMPNARFEMIRGAEHFIWSTHESELRSLLRQFVGQLA